MQRIFVLGVSLLTAYGAGFVGSLFTAPAISTWYATLVQPALSPPNWLFAPVWTALYTLMAVAAFLVWAAATQKGRAAALWLYALQLVLNVLWSYVFFGLRTPGLAFGVILALWFAIAATAYLFYKVSKPASYLLLPYLAWVTFAGYLNYLLWVLN